MKETINLSQFIDAFNIRKENFSYNGLNALYDYLTNLEEDLNEEIELDVIALCCEYSELTYEEYLDSYDVFSEDEIKEYKEEETLKEKTREHIQNNTTFIEIDEESFIIQCY